MTKVDDLKDKAKETVFEGLITMLGQSMGGVEKLVSAGSNRLGDTMTGMLPGKQMIMTFTGLNDIATSIRKSIKDFGRMSYSAKKGFEMFVLHSLPLYVRLLDTSKSVDDSVHQLQLDFADQLAGAIDTVLEISKAKPKKQFFGKKAEVVTQQQYQDTLRAQSYPEVISRLNSFLDSVIEVSANAQRIIAGDVTTIGGR